MGRSGIFRVRRLDSVVNGGILSCCLYVVGGGVRHPRGRGSALCAGD